MKTKWSIVSLYTSEQFNRLASQFSLTVALFSNFEAKPPILAKNYFI